MASEALGPLSCAVALTGVSVVTAATGAEEVLWCGVVGGLCRWLSIQPPTPTAASRMTTTIPTTALVVTARCPGGCERPGDSGTCWAVAQEEKASLRSVPGNGGRSAYGSAGGGADGIGAISASACASRAGVVSGGRSRRDRWNSASQTTASIAAGTPARTCRGLHGRPSANGAGGREVVVSRPGQCAVSVAYSSLPRPWVSVRSGSALAEPDSAASMPRPVSLTPPPGVQRRQAGVRQRWASPAACAPAIALAASLIRLTPWAGSSGPLASRSSSESPATHSITM